MTYSDKAPELAQQLVEEHFAAKPMAGAFDLSGIVAVVQAIISWLMASGIDFAKVIDIGKQAVAFIVSKDWLGLIKLLLSLATPKPNTDITLP